MVTAVALVGFWGPDLFVASDVLSVVTGVLAAGCCLSTGLIRRGSMRVAWCLFAVLMAMYAIGDGLWLAFEDAGGNAPILGVADAMYLGAFVPATLGLLAYPVLRDVRGLLVPLALDAAVLSTSVLFISHTLVLDTIFRTADGALEGFMLAVYPITDVMITCMVLLMLLRSIGQPRLDVALVGATFVIYTFADNGYALMTLHGSDTIGSAVDLGYTVAPLVLAVAATAAAAMPAPRRATRRHLTGAVAPLLPDLTALGALALAVAVGTHSTMSTILGVVTLLAVGTRQVALTSAGHKLRGQLQQRVAERTQELDEMTEHYRLVEAMKYDFVSAVSHELRTPLAAIRGALEMLDDGDAGMLPPRARSVIAIAARGSERLSRLVNDIIDLERLESGRFAFHPGRHDLAEMVAEATRSMLPLAHERDVEIQVDMAQGTTAWCDPDRIQQVLVNLLGNAIKFSPPSTVVTVAARLSGDEVVVSVRDRGRGIPLSELESIFERFHQVEVDDARQNGGAGLGLTICQRIIDSHGGRIWVDSPSRGTTFSFTLPRFTTSGPDIDRPVPEDAYLHSVAAST